ncbi:hypothetical protein H0W91_00700 [Patescibacteria group bacterium]|nr:hypothetical protein [Patescibacteria group bacterium]
MEKNREIHLLYKELGETPLETILRFKKNNPEFTDQSMTYAGRLDPMAEGLLLVLSGSALMEKEKYMGMEKTYEFEILWGFETDTLDLLGIVKLPIPNIKNCPDIELIKEKLEKSVGKFEQKYPAFSSKPVLGKPLFQWAREGRIDEIEIPKHDVEIFSTTFLNRRELNGADLLKNISEKIALVKGDFRQLEILEKWQKALIDLKENNFTIDKIQVTASSGFYVRQFISDISEIISAKALSFHIKRTKIGEFSLND